MSQPKGKLSLKSKKDISEPNDFRHIEHIGPKDVQSTENKGNGSCISFTEDEYVERCRKFSRSGYFEQNMRTLIREEVTKITQAAQKELEKTLETNKEKLSEEIARLKQLITTSVDSTDSKDPSENKAKFQNFNADLIYTDHVIQSEGSKIFQNKQYQWSSDEPEKPEDPTAKKYKKNAVRSFVQRADHHPSSAKGKAAELKSYSKPGPAVRRECMAQALQANIIPIVECLEFKQSSLPEQLISAGHLTEEECDTIRNDKSRKDQVRHIVSRTKCRSLQDMEEFLGLIDEQVPDIVVNIREKFEENLKRNDNRIKCKLCLCFDNIDVKEVIDILWSRNALSDEFYKKAINCSEPRGCQERLWQSLIKICNSKQAAERAKVFGDLFNYIQNVGRSGKFEFLVTGLRSMLENKNRFSCHCNELMTVKSKLSEVSNESSRISSYSPRSSSSVSDGRQSNLSGEFNDEIDNDGDGQYKSSSWGSLKKPEKRQSFNEEMSDETIPKQKLHQAQSLDVLDTITEEGDITFRKGKNIIQTLEFHHAVGVQVDFERRNKNRNTNYDNQTTKNPDAVKMDSKRYGEYFEDFDIILPPLCENFSDI